MSEGHSGDAMRRNGSSAAAGTERVLCVCRSDLPASWLPRRGSVPLSWDGLEDGLQGVRPLLRIRDEIETDPAFKQWIPYGLLCRPDGTVACYRRQGDERRLHGLLSVGVGGHVSQGDVVHPGSAWRPTLVRGLLRELREELPGISVDREPECLGLVNEDTSAVGRVHLGLVCRVEVSAGEGWDRATELGEAAWVAPDVLRRDGQSLGLELWSALALELPAAGRG